MARLHLNGEREERTYSEKLFCVPCGLGYELLDPRLFSFNSRQGACPDCSGLGARWEFDPALVVPDKSKSLDDGRLVAANAIRVSTANMRNCCVS